jgi:hypothetical protein
MLKRALRRARRALNGDVLDEVVRLRAEVSALRAEQATQRAVLEGDMKAILAQLDQALLTIAFAGARGE